MHFLVDLKLQFDHLSVEEIYFLVGFPEFIPVVSNFLEGSAVHSIGFYEIPFAITDEQRCVLFLLNISIYIIYSGHIVKCIEQFKPECVQLYTAQDQIHMPCKCIFEQR